jgi:hypothetical protein
MWNPEDLDKLVRAVAMTRDEEIGCYEVCLERLDRYVEMTLSGMDAAAAMPLVQDHLEKCGDCREEFEMLLEALRTTEGSEPVGSLWARLRRMFGAR